MTLLLLHHQQLQNLQLSCFLAPGLVLFLVTLSDSRKSLRTDRLHQRLQLFDLFSEILAFLKQLTIVVWLTSFHADASNCKAVNNNTFGSGLLDSRLRSISFTNRFL